MFQSTICILHCVLNLLSPLSLSLCVVWARYLVACTYCIEDNMQAEFEESWLLKTDVDYFLEKLKEENIMCYDVEKTTVSKLKGMLKKDKMALHFRQSLVYNDKQYFMTSKVFAERDMYRKQLLESQKLLIESQQRIVKLQDELLLSKTEQLKSLQSTVTASVESSVKAEFVSYSDKLKKSPAPTVAVPAETLKNVVKSVVEEEDRTRSVMLFGLPEESVEPVGDQVSKVFAELGVSPRFEASRLGRKRQSAVKARPVKVNLSNSAAVSTVLLLARDLKESDNYSSVFICPDRSPTQRTFHKGLVAEMKKLDEGEPDKRHFIRGGKVCSVLKIREKSND